jgi:hypothetical protein
MPNYRYLSEEEFNQRYEEKKKDANIKFTKNQANPYISDCIEKRRDKILNQEIVKKS